MNYESVKTLLIDQFDSLSPQLQRAARFILDHEDDVALLSMRDQAAKADVQPASMTRLAQALGLDGYDTIRNAYAHHLRNRDHFTQRIDAQHMMQKMQGDGALALETLHAISNQLNALSAPASIDDLVIGAQKLAGARKIYCAGVRASHAMAWYFSYVTNLIGGQSVFLSQSGDIGADILSTMTPQDCILAIGVSPYAQVTYDIAAFGKQNNVPILAVTDSEVSPLAQLADHSIFVSTQSPSFFPSMASTFITMEILSTLVAGLKGQSAHDAMIKSEQRLDFFNTYYQTDKSRTSS